MRISREEKGSSQVRERPGSSSPRGRPSAKTDRRRAGATVSADREALLREADLVLFVGCKVNYVDTDIWQAPSLLLARASVVPELAERVMTRRATRQPRACNGSREASSRLSLPAPEGPIR